MKVTFVGGGAHRFASASRTLLARRESLAIQEIALYDLNRERAATMARFIEMTPEFRAQPCRITWDQTLDEAIDEADLVCVVIFVGNPLTHELATHACGRHGFICSQNCTPSGAINGLKVGAVVLDLAKRMERLCPDAWLLNFCNPVAVVSGVINNHSKVFGLGICEGFGNHLWDIPRLFGRDEKAVDVDIHAAGVNHMSFIAPGSTFNGRDLYQQLDELLAAGPWVPPQLKGQWTQVSLHGQWSQTSQDSIINGLRQLLTLYKRYGRLAFSTEHDGLALLNIGEVHEPWAQRLGQLTRADAERSVEATRLGRHAADQRLAALVQAASGQIDWDDPDPENSFLRKDEDNLMVLLTRAKAGERIRVATNVLNNGAIHNLPDRYVVEFTQIFEDRKLRPTRHHVLPDPLFPWIAAFAAHQTLLGDAIAHDCPETLVKALSCYPVHRDTKAFWEMWKELLQISSGDLSRNLAKAVDLLPCLPPREG